MPAWRVAVALWGVTVKVVIAVTWLANSAITANNDIRLQRITSAVCGTRLGTVISVSRDDELGRGQGSRSSEEKNRLHCDRYVDGTMIAGGGRM